MCVTHMSYRCYSNVFVCLVFHMYVTRMSSVCHLYVLVCHPYVTLMYSYVICMSLISHPYVTRMYSYVIHMSLVCGFTVNLYYMQMLPINRHNTVLVQMELSNDFQLIIHFSCLENVQKSSALNH